MTSTVGPPKLINLYNLRQTATAKPCFICSKETSHCLANAELSDWMYVCHGHVLDPAFAKPAPSSTTTTSGTSTPSAPSSPTPPVPQSEIDKVKAEYAEKQKRKQSTASDKDKDKDTKPTPGSKDANESGTAGGKAFSVLKSSVSTLSSLASSASSSILFPPPEPVIPSPSELLRQEAKMAKQFVLNRSYFDMRVAKKRREWEIKDAKERSKEWSFPTVPRGGLPNLP